MNLTFHHFQDFGFLDFWISIFEFSIFDFFDHALSHRRECPAEEGGAEEGAGDEEGRLGAPSDSSTNLTDLSISQTISLTEYRFPEQFCKNCNVLGPRVLLDTVQNRHFREISEKIARF